VNTSGVKGWKRVGLNGSASFSSGQGAGATWVGAGRRRALRLGRGRAGRRRDPVRALLRLREERQIPLWSH